MNNLHPIDPIIELYIHTFAIPILSILSLIEYLLIILEAYFS